VIQSMSLQPRILGGSVVSPAPAREASQPGSEWWRNTYRSSVSHRSPASSCLTGCSLPLSLASQASNPPRLRNSQGFYSHWAFSFLIPVPFPLERARSDRNQHQCLLHTPLAAALRPDAAAMQRTLELVRAPNQSSCRVTLPGASPEMPLPRTCEFARTEWIPSCNRTLTRILANDCQCPTGNTMTPTSS